MRLLRAGPVRGVPQDALVPEAVDPPPAGFASWSAVTMRIPFRSRVDSRERSLPRHSASLRACYCWLPQAIRASGASMSKANKALRGMVHRSGGNEPLASQLSLTARADSQHMPTPASKADELSEDSSVRSAQLRIVNIFARVDFGRPLDLRRMSLAIHESEYEPETTPGLIVRTKEPRSCVTLYRSGIARCTGCRSPAEVQAAAGRGPAAPVGLSNPG